MNSNQNHRRTIGLLMADFPKDQPFFSGVVAAARKYDLNLFCTLGKLLHWQGDFNYQGNVLYDLADSEHLDGLVTWAGAGVAMGRLATQAEMQAFFGKFAHKPVVNYEKPIAGLHSVRTDTAEAMKEVLRHLIGAHQRQRILLLRGPEQHFETEERVRAYRETLAEFGLPYRPELILPAIEWMVDFNEAIRQRLDQSGLVPGQDFDAIAGTENYMACAAIRVLRAKGIHIPSEIAVVGFNEALDNRASHPPLTTVDKHFYAAGQKCVEVLMKLIDGEDQPPESLVAGKLLLRGSCGCGSQPAEVVKISVQAIDPEWIERLAQAAQDLAGQMDLQPAPGWSRQIITAFLDSLRGGEKLAFGNAITDLLLSARGENSSQNWIRVLAHLRGGLRSALAKGEEAAAENLWLQAGLCVHEYFEQELIQQNVTLIDQNLRYNRFAAALSAAVDLAGLLDVLAKELPALGIPSCYLSLYADPSQPSGEARLILAVRGGQRLALPAGGQLFPARQLTPPELLPSQRGYAMIVEPLYYQERQLGFITQEYTDADELLFEFLQKQISIALDRQLVHQEAQESYARYRALVDNLREMILVQRGGELLFANRSARLYFEQAKSSQALLEAVMKKTPQSLEREKFASAEDSEFEIDLSDGEGGQRRMIVRKQEVLYGLAPAEQVILIDITERKRLEDHLHFMSTRDGLTGLYNRAFFEREMTRQHTPDEFPLSIIVLDVDDLKIVNDQQGHVAGDQLLRLAADSLRGAFRAEDVISRIGGDEFAVIISRMGGMGTAKMVERLQQRLEQTEHAGARVSLSAGWASAEYGEELLETFKKADQAMYRAKARKKKQRLSNR